MNYAHSKLATKIRRLTFSLVLVCVGCMATESLGQLGAVGFDNFGYIGNETPFDLRDIQLTGTQLSLGDDVTSLQSLGFDFDYYGTTFNTVNVSSNGFLSFTNAASACCTSAPLPGVGGTGGAANAPENLIAGAWTDLDPTEGGEIYVETRGPVGSRQFIAGFYDVQHNLDFGAAPTPSTFEIILHEGSNNIELQYSDLMQQADNNGTTSEQISIGIQNATRDDGLQVAFFPEHANTTDASVISSQGYRITRQTDIGSLQLGGGGLSPAAQRLDRGEVRWFRFDLQSDIQNAANRFLVVNTYGSKLTLDGSGQVDTEIGLYDATGSRVANDDDGGVGRFSELEFGAAGSDGDLAVGTYYIAASAYQTNHSPSNYDAQSDSPQTGNIEVNVVLGTEIGTLNNGLFTTPAETLNSGEALFYRFEIVDGVFAAYGDSLVIDTNGSTLTISNDTELGLYDGQGNLLANDDDGGPSTVAQLSFGAGGSDGDLPAGTYYLSASGFNTSFFDDFNVSVSSTRTGDMVLNLDLDNLVDDLLGDFDGNGVVNGDDYLAWQRGESPNPFSTGDLNDWQNNYGDSLPLVATTAQVPEPAGLILGAIAGICLLVQRRYS